MPTALPDGTESCSGKIKAEDSPFENSGLLTCWAHADDCEAMQECVANGTLIQTVADAIEAKQIEKMRDVLAFDQPILWHEYGFDPDGEVADALPSASLIATHQVKDEASLRASI